MKIFILFTLLLIIKSTDIQTCSCQDLLTEFECNGAVSFQVASQDMFKLKVCFWTQGLCLDIINDLLAPCTQFSEEVCKNIPSCAWYNSNCVNFSQCSDYKFEKSILSKSCDEINCLDNGTTCTFDLLGRSDQLCEDVAFEEDCQRMYLLYKKTICNWNGSTCVGQKLSSCSSLTEKQCLQANAQCIWKNNSCVKRSCEDGQYSFYQQEGIKLCSSYLDIETDQVMYCEVNEEGQCITADPEELNRKNCYSQSFQQYRWQPTDKECQKCF